MRNSRYSAVAIVLHWLIAILVLSMIPMGWWMSDAIADPAQQATAYKAFQLHKSVGFTILGLTVIRLVWRISHRPPAMPMTRAWERYLALGAHAVFYFLLLALPLTGWLYVSTGWAVATDQPLEVATSWFGLFTVPHLPVAEAAASVRRSLAFEAMGAHSLMAWGVLVMAALHVGAALKHQFLDRDGIMEHMIPVLKGRHDEPGRPFGRREAAATWAVALLATLALAAVGWSLGAPAAREIADAPAQPPVGAGADVSVQPGTATAWTIDASSSAIRFAGLHAGAAFNGRFERWEGKVWFDPSDLAGSRADIVIQTGSARTGDATQENSLGAPEWFDPAHAPTARFQASDFRALGGDRYEAVGTLRVKAAIVPVRLPFTFQRQGEKATVRGKVELDRTALDLGLASDPSGQWVSKAIEVTVDVVATADG